MTIFVVHNPLNEELVCCIYVLYNEKMMLDFVLLLTLTILIGGMITFQALFAPLIFIKLPANTARPFIRQFFPFYYLYFGILSLIFFVLTMIMFSSIINLYSIAALLIFTGFVISRQVLMPLANNATDTGKTAVFKRYHMATVLINTAQLIILIFLFYQRLL